VGEQGGEQQALDGVTLCGGSGFSREWLRAGLRG